MAPNVLRPTFLWCVPTVAILLSFLWFKRKRCGLRSDPGGTKPKSDKEDIREVKDTEDNCNRFSHTCVNQESVQDKSREDGEESVTIKLSEDATEVPDRVKLNIHNCTSESHTILLPESFPKTQIEDSIGECVLGNSADSVAGNLSRQLKQDSEIVVNQKESLVSESLAEKSEVLSLKCDRENLKDSGITVEEFCKENPITGDPLPILQSGVALENSQGKCENVTIEMSQEKLTKMSVAENNNNEILLTQMDMVESIATTMSNLELVENGYTSGNNQNTSENALATGVSDFSNENTLLNSCQESLSASVNSQELNKENMPAENSPPVESSVCDTISDVNVIKCVISENSDSIVVVDKISEVACASAVPNVSHSSITRTIEENDGEVAQQSLSCLKELADGQDNSGGNGNESPLPAGAERDSANHSPADVMLASPSMSNYSDVHSEGSSDSGKGCSYVATPPSRTPASCSSLSGDLSTHSVYEFVLPQQLVGRLIGRHGSFVHQIKAKTHAHILIKRHPDTPKLKICAVEGTQLDIESALEMIREKFPAKRYPSITLEQVCFLPPVPTVALIPEHLQLQLVEGVNNDVILSSLVSPAHFFLQQPTHPTFPALNQLSACMNMSYSERDAPLLPSIEAGIICAASTMGGWYRAQVVSVDSETDSSDVKFIDYGGYLTLPNSELRQIRSDFMTLPFQAAECYLAHVIPAGGTNRPWSAEARAYVEALTQGQVLQAQVCGYAEDGVPVVYLFATQGTQVVPIHQGLVAQGLAEWWEPSES